MNAIDKIVRFSLIVSLWAGAFIAGGTRNAVISGILFVVAAFFSHQATWKPEGNADRLIRYGFLVSLWFVTFLFSAYTLSPGQGLFLLGILCLVVVLFTSVVMFPRYDDQKQPIAKASATAKRKNDQRPPVDPLDLLTENDLAELRQEVKEEIRARLRYGSDDEVSNLEDLLDH